MSGMNCTVEDLVRRGAIRRLLVATGLVYEEAIDDAEGFDGETTLGRVVEFEESLILLVDEPNKGLSTKQEER